MKNQFKNHFTNQFPNLDNKKLLIAISGGLDSVVLAHLCHSIGLNIAFAHCNFSLRGIESDSDQKFVQQLAQQLDCPFFTKTFSTEAFAKEEKLSIQLAARELRYQWFKTVLKTEAYSYVLTAHHSDDNLETLLINLSRGTGLAGLTGIPAQNESVLRPLLPFTREQIETYAKANQITWREDSSNASTKYLRNKLRHDVIPLLKEINPHILENTNKTISYLKETQDIVSESVKAVLKRAIKSNENGVVTYHISELKKVNNAKAYLTEIFKPYGFKAFLDIAHLLDAETGKFVSSQTHKLTKDQKTLVLSNVNTKHQFNTLTISNLEKPVDLPQQTLQFETVKEAGKNTKTEVFIDKGLLKLPLEVSLKKEGDYFCPIGMLGKKKLSKYFKDEKLSLLDREKVLLLRSKDAVVWVINHRLDHRFRVTKQTKHIIKISLK